MAPWAKLRLVRQTLIGDPDKMTGAGVSWGEHARAPVKVFLWVPYGGMQPWVPGNAAADDWFHGDGPKAGKPQQRRGRGLCCAGGR